MCEIIAYVNLFTANQPIYYSNGKDVPQLVASVPVDMLGTTTAQLSFKYDTNNIHLFGQEEFLKKIANQTEACGVKQYGENKLKVRIN